MNEAKHRDSPRGKLQALQGSGGCPGTPAAQKDPQEVPEIAQAQRRPDETASRGPADREAEAILRAGIKDPRIGDDTEKTERKEAVFPSQSSGSQRGSLSPGGAVEERESICPGENPGEKLTDKQADEIKDSLIEDPKSASGSSQRAGGSAQKSLPQLQTSRERIEGKQKSQHRWPESESAQKGVRELPFLGPADRPNREPRKCQAKRPASSGGEEQANRSPSTNLLAKRPPDKQVEQDDKEEQEDLPGKTGWYQSGNKDGAENQQQEVERAAEELLLPNAEPQTFFQ